MYESTRKSTDVNNVQNTYKRDMKSLNNNFIAGSNDEVEDYYKCILTDCSTLSNAYLHRVEASTTDTQKRFLTNSLTSEHPNRAKPGIVLITTKLNQSDETKLMHYNASSSGKTDALNEINLKTFNSDQVVTKEIATVTSLKQYTIESREQQPKTATILVSKSKTKTGLPLLLKKSK